MKNGKLILLSMLTLTSGRVSGQDILLINAKIHTEAVNDILVNGSVYCRDGKIVEVSEGNLLKSKVPKIKTIDLRHKAIVYPGFIDAHCHFTGAALDAYKCSLYDTKSAEDMIRQVRRYADTSTMAYIYGRGWDQNTWSTKSFPDKKELDKLFPDKIVILKRIDGHAILVNQYALDKAAITNETEVEGGQIIKEGGKLTGILIDNAMQKVEDLIPELPQNKSVTWLKLMEENCFKNGLTYVVDCGLAVSKIELLDKLYTKKSIGIGMTALLAADDQTLFKYVSTGPFKNGQFSVSGIKVYADGALGSRGACLLQPYTDDSGNYGTMLTSQVALIRIAYEAKKYNWQLCTHAIGDSANRTVLKAYDLVLEVNNNNRWRIEHAQVVNPADYPIFKNKSIIPSVQPTHAIADMSWAEARLGKTRIHNAYSYKALLNAAGTIALGTDFPVVGINPLMTFYAAVARKDSAGNPSDGFNPEGKLSREEALKGMTIWAAKSVFEEAWKGSIEPDKDADFTILDTDLLECPESSILKAKVLYTIVGGKIVYQKKD